MATRASYCTLRCVCTCSPERHVHPEHFDQRVFKTKSDTQAGLFVSRNVGGVDVGGVNTWLSSVVCGRVWVVTVGGTSAPPQVAALQVKMGQMLLPRRRSQLLLGYSGLICRGTNKTTPPSVRKAVGEGKRWQYCCGSRRGRTVVLQKTKESWANEQEERERRKERGGKRPAS